MFLKDLTPKEVRTLEKLGSQKSYAQGEYVIKEGAPGTEFALILDGKVEVRKNLSDKHSKVVAKLSACDVVGDLGFFGTSPRSADVIALEATQILEFDRKKLDKFASSHPKTGVKLYRNLATILATRLADTSAELREAVVWSIATNIERTRMPDIRQVHGLAVSEG